MFKKKNADTSARDFPEFAKPRKKFQFPVFPIIPKSLSSNLFMY